MSERDALLPVFCLRRDAARSKPTICSGDSRIAVTSVLLYIGWIGSIELYIVVTIIRSRLFHKQPMQKTIDQNATSAAAISINAFIICSKIRE